MIRQTTTAPVASAAQATASGSIINVVSTIADLKALPAVSRKGAVLVLGKFAPADAGGGFYWWNATDTRADNGTTVLIPT